MGGSGGKWSNRVPWTREMRKFKKNRWDVTARNPCQWLVMQPHQETKGRRPPWLTRFGFPKEPRTPADQTGYTGKKYCDMSMIHQMDRRRPYARSWQKPDD